MMSASSRLAPRGARCALHAALLTALLAPAAAPADDTVPAPAFKPGMSWTYRQRDELGGRETGIVRLEIVAVAADRVTVGHAVPGEPTVNERWDAIGNWEQVGTQGSAWLARLGGEAKRVEFVPALPLYRFPLSAGQSWVETVRAVEPGSGRKIEVKVFAKALAWEEVAVPAGKFRALKVRRFIAPEDADATRSPTTVTLIDWYAPQVDGMVKRICDWEYRDPRQPSADQLKRGPRLRFELMAFEPPR
jgi:hypothetical protein